MELDRINIYMDKNRNFNQEEDKVPTYNQDCI